MDSAESYPMLDWLKAIETYLEEHCTNRNIDLNSERTCIVDRGKVESLDLKELPESFLSALPGARHTALVALLKRALDLYSGVPERDARADLTAFNLGFIWGEILMFQEVTSCPALTYDKQSYAIYGKKQSTVRRGRKADAPPAVVEYVKRLAREAKHRNSNLSPWDIALEICNKHRDSLRKPDKQNEHFSEQTVYKWVREELNKKSNSTI